LRGSLPASRGCGEGVIGAELNHVEPHPRELDGAPREGPIALANLVNRDHRDYCCGRTDLHCFTPSSLETISFAARRAASVLTAAIREKVPLMREEEAKPLHLPCGRRLIRIRWSN